MTSTSVEPIVEEFLTRQRVVKHAAIAHDEALT